MACPGMPSPPRRWSGSHRRPLDSEHIKETKGFKNIPTLDAITVRSLSVDGTAVPPEVEPIENPQTPGVMAKPPERSL